MIEEFNAGARQSNEEEVGREHLVLIEGLSKKSDREWVGRTDTNKRVVLARDPVPHEHGAARAAGETAGAAGAAELQPGEYAAVRVTAALSANTLRAEPLVRSSISGFTGQA